MDAAKIEEIDPKCYEGGIDLRDLRGINPSPMRLDTLNGITKQIEDKGQSSLPYIIYMSHESTAFSPAMINGRQGDGPFEWYSNKDFGLEGRVNSEFVDKIFGEQILRQIQPYTSGCATLVTTYPDITKAMLAAQGIHKAEGKLDGKIPCILAKYRYSEDEILLELITGFEKL